MSTYRIITTTWISTGVDPDGNPVPVLSWDESAHPTVGEYMVAAGVMTTEQLAERTATMGNLPVTVVARMATPADPTGTSHVVDFYISHDLTIFDDVVAAVKAELEVRRNNTTTKAHGIELQITERDE